DTISLRSDHTFTQTYDDRVTHDHLQSEGQGWWLESRDNGRTYLHLPGMRKCDDLNVCRQGGGGGNRFWYDFCEQRIIRMPGEVILLVLGVPPDRIQPPRSIELYHLLVDGDTSSTYYTLAN